MTKVLLYSDESCSIGDIHDLVGAAVGAESQRREVSVLVISGAPVRDGFRLGPGVYRVHLPRVDDEASRAELIRNAVEEFVPDAIVVDKARAGAETGIDSTLSYAREHLPDTSLVLVLRDKSDQAAPGRTASGQDAAAEAVYDRVLTMG